MVAARNSPSVSSCQGIEYSTARRDAGAATRPPVLSDSDKRRNGQEVIVSRVVPSEVRSSCAGERPLLSLLCAVCLGVVLDRFSAPAPVIWWLLFGAALLLWCGVRRWASAQGAAWCVLAAAVALGGRWHHERWWRFESNEIGLYARDLPAPACLRVIVCEPPRTSPAEPPSPLCSMGRDELTSVDVAVEQLRQRGDWVSVSGRARLQVSGRLAPLLRGDRLEVAGTLVRVRSPGNPGEPNLAALRRQSRQLVSVFCDHAACVTVRDRGSEWSALRMVGRLRVWAEGVWDRRLPPRQADLAAALLVGSRERLDRALVQQFFLSGTIHVLSISGMHVSILASAMWVCIRLGWFPRRGLLLVTSALAIAYALLAGSEPPVVRATVLIVVCCLGQALTRRASAWNSLAAAGLVTVAVSPGEIFDVGTQLSFLAVAVLFSRWTPLTPARRHDPLTRLIDRSRPAWLRAVRAIGFALWQLVVTSLAVWLVTLPLAVNRFHLVPLWGPALTLLQWIPVATSLFCGVGMLLTDCLPWVPDLLAWLCEQALVATEWMTTGCLAAWPGYVWEPGPSLRMVVVFYAGLAALQFVLPPQSRARRWGLFSIWWLVLLASSGTAARAWYTHFPRPLTVSCIAVGHGSSVLLELPRGEAVLYDAGRMGPPMSALQPISAVLWSKGITHLDAVIVTHADVDHFNAVPGLVDRFSVGRVCVSPTMFAGDVPAVQVLRAALRRAAVPVAQVRAGDQHRTRDGVELAVLHPPAGGCRGGDNSNSIVLEVRDHERRRLLTGDLEADGLDRLLSQPSMDVDLLLAPHHGSRLSRPRDVVAWTRPEIVVVSAGAGAGADGERFQTDFGESGARVLWTHVEGMVQLKVTAEAWEVSTFRGGPAERAPRGPSQSGRLP